MGEWLFFAYPKKSHQKKRYPTCPPCGCPAMLEWTGGMLNSLRSDRRIPKTPAQPVLLGEPERGFKVKIKNEVHKTKKQRKINYLSSFRHASSRNPFYYTFWIPAFAVMTKVQLRCS